MLEWADGQTDSMCTLLPVPHPIPELDQKVYVIFYMVLTID